jgi:hypothetical protein
MNVRIPYSCPGTLDDTSTILVSGRSASTRQSEATRPRVRGQGVCSRSWPIPRGSNSQPQVLNPIRRPIHQIARKLRHAKSRGYPLVAGLTRSAQSALGIVLTARTSSRHDYPRLFKSGQAGTAALVSSRNRDLRRHDHPYVVPWSWSMSSTPAPSVRLLYVTHSPAAVPLSPVFFAARCDAFYELIDHRRQLRRRLGSTRTKGLPEGDSAQLTAWPVRRSVRVGVQARCRLSLLRFGGLRCRDGVGDQTLSRDDAALTGSEQADRAPAGGCPARPGSSW